VLITADDLYPGTFQIPALVAAGYRVPALRQPRGIGATDTPEGPYTSTLLADDAKALVDQFGFMLQVSPHGRLHGRNDRRGMRDCPPDDITSLTLACTFGTADLPAAGRCLAAWAIWHGGLVCPSSRGMSRSGYLHRTNFSKSGR
jgi:3-oxoadipate enol-lactonase